MKHLRLLVCWEPPYIYTYMVAFMKNKIAAACIENFIHIHTVSTMAFVNILTSNSLYVIANTRMCLISAVSNVTKHQIGISRLVAWARRLETHFASLLRRGCQGK